MTIKISNESRFEVLSRVLDSLCNEAPASLKIYHPPSQNEERRIQARSRALIHLFLKSRFGLLDFRDREPFVTDGPFDGGIDAFYLDKRNKRIYVLQSKFRATKENFAHKSMSADDLLRMDVKRILKGEKRDSHGNRYNERIRQGLQKAVRNLPDAASYETTVVLLGNSHVFSPESLKRLVEGYPTDQWSHNRIYQELLFPVVNGTYYNEPDLKIEINLENLKRDSHLDYDVKAHGLRSNIKLLFVPTKEIGRIMYTYRNSILEFNPRSFLELQHNAVNQEIEASITGSDENEFALFNNGLTIISDQTSVSSDTGKQGIAQIVVHNPQLVNGGQTAYSLSRIYERCLASDTFKIFRDKEVLLRVITRVGAAKRGEDALRLKLIGDISKASNSQTRVDESDRRSNDKIQVALQKAVYESYGFFYERKRGEFSDGLRLGYIDNDSLINREKLVRVSLASEYRVSQARSNIGRFFNAESLADVLRVSHVDRYVYGYGVLRILERKRRERPRKKGDRYHIKDYGQGLRYGQYAIVAVSVNLGMKKNTPQEKAAEAILWRWKGFERWAMKRRANSDYRVQSSFDWISYYKGATINSDLQRYRFII